MQWVNIRRDVNDCESKGRVGENRSVLKSESDTRK